MLRFGRAIKRVVQRTGTWQRCSSGWFFWGLETFLNCTRKANNSTADPQLEGTSQEELSAHGGRPHSLVAAFAFPEHLWCGKGIGLGRILPACGHPGEDPHCAPLTHVRAVSSLWSLHPWGEENGIGMTRAVYWHFLLATLALPHLGICVNCPCFRRWSHLSLLQLPHLQQQPFCASAGTKTTQKEVAPNSSRVFTAVHKERRLGM